LPDENNIRPRTEARPLNAGASPESEERVRIYFLPNLLTAGNLACGFFALTWIFKYGEVELGFEPIKTAIRLILAAFAFDLFDGRLARLAKKESRFGREFDSLADIVSFGVAPAFLIYRIVLQEFESGWVVAAIYLVCGGIRLARFNVQSMRPGSSDGREFVGFPIPSAAALVVSVTMLIMWMAGHEKTLGNWRFVLPVLMLLLSALMVSNVRYPTFKYIDWTLSRSVATFAMVVIVGLLLARYFQITLALLFIAYLLYGLVRPWVSKRWRREIESDEESEDDSPEG
jgi:CDP-diacylglycerol--serine O-phosphatidyltransferase